MYEHNENQIIMPHEFFLPFGGQLNPDNRWVVMASHIPWNEVEVVYIKTLGDTKQGSKAYNVRLALGSLIIKERLGLSDEETVEAITENPYLQYFIGLHSFQQVAPFHSSSMTHFRKRFNAELINELNESIVLEQRKKDERKTKETVMKIHQMGMVLHPKNLAFQVPRNPCCLQIKENCFWTQLVHHPISPILRISGY